MTQEMHPFEMAKAAQPVPTPEPNVDTAKEVFPVRFEKDRSIRDFGHVESAEAPSPERVDETPKASPALESVMSPSLPTGLEDVSSDDLETPVPTSAEKDTQTKSESSLPTSSESTTPGRTEQLVETSSLPPTTTPSSQTSQT